MTLRDLLNNVEIQTTTADLNTEILSISYDSRKTQPGDLFVALAGYETDGYQYIEEAVNKGAVVVLCEKTPTIKTPYILINNARRALAIISANFFHHPAKDLTLIGVTGTCGKTSTTYLIKQILQQGMEAKVGLIGTNQNMIEDTVLPAIRTTPESYEVQQLFAQMKERGCTHVVMEVTSHALALDRVYGIHFDIGLFTNLSQDHLDFHQTMENYCDAKAILFQNCDIGIYNGEDPWAQRLIKDTSCKKISFGERENLDLFAQNMQLNANSISFEAVYQGQSQLMQLNIPGKFMVYNTLAALAVALQLNLSLAESAKALQAMQRVKGRIEVVPTPDSPFTVLIDFAHTPNSLQNVLSTVKEFAPARLVALFGCGGDRDKTKRPIMGKIAADIADFVILTSDNPRTEVPISIIQDIEEGIKNSKTPYIVIEDRVKAIEWALTHAQKEDIIILCGKGHELDQEVNGVKHAMDERKIVTDFLNRYKIND